ncbi:MAG: DUF1501 domain-containing protein [Verrucomicrobiales bacterium]
MAAEVAGIHHRPKAKQVISFSWNGRVSQMDSFDPKPKLAALDGQRFDPGAGQLVESVTNSPGFEVLASPFAFRQHGQCGRWVSAPFPHMAGIVDDLAFLMSQSAPTNVHGIGSYLQNTGFALPGFPCLGAWVSYALGRISRDLPDFVVMPDPNGLPYNNLGNFSAGFLPARHQGSVIDAASDHPVPFLDLLPGAEHLTAEERGGRSRAARQARPRLRQPLSRRLAAGGAARSCGWPPACSSARQRSSSTCAAKARRPARSTGSMKRRPPTTGSAACWRGA